MRARATIHIPLPPPAHHHKKPRARLQAAGVAEMIKGQVTENPVMLYMKGTPSQPQCGFSQQVCRILHATGVEFASVNVLEDETIREGVKAYSEWPTIPQLYVGGEFIGGCDIVTESFQSGELDDAFKAAGAKE